MPRPARGHPRGHCKGTLRIHPEDTLQDTLRTDPDDSFRDRRMQPKDVFQDPPKAHSRCLQDAPPEKSPRTGTLKHTPGTHSKTPQGHLKDTTRTDFEDNHQDAWRTHPQDTCQDTRNTSQDCLRKCAQQRTCQGQLEDTLQDTSRTLQGHSEDTSRGHTPGHPENTS